MTSNRFVDPGVPGVVDPGVDARPPSRSPRTSEARARILRTATRLFYGTGIRAVGVDRLIAESEVARMTFFRHFPTKDHLVVAFLEAQEAAGVQELLRTRAEGGPRAVLALIAEGVRTVPAGDGFRGCEFINTAAEFCDPGHPAHAIAARHRAWIRDQLAAALTELDHPSPQTTAELLLMFRTGAIVASSLEGLDDLSAFDRAWWALIDGPAR